MAVGRSVITDCIEKMQQAAQARQKAHAALIEDDDITPDERRSLEHRIAIENRRIKQYAEKINDALKHAAEKRERIGQLALPSSLSDPLLAQFVRSVEKSVRQLNELVDTDSPELARSEAKLDRQLVEAERHEQGYLRAIDELERRLEEIERRAKRAAQIEGERKRQRKELEQRLARMEAEKNRLREEERRVADQDKAMRREIARLESELRNVQAARRAARSLDRKKAEKAKAQQLQQRIADLKQRHERTIEAKRIELKHAQRYFEREEKQLAEVRKICERDLEQATREVGELERARQETLQRLREERKRLDQVRNTIARIKNAKASVY